jgi:hypothetical protein
MEACGLDRGEDFGVEDLHAAGGQTMAAGAASEVQWFFLKPCRAGGAASPAAAS